MRIDGYVFVLFNLPCSAWTPIPGTVTPSWARCTSGTSVIRNTAANNVPNTYKYITAKCRDYLSSGCHYCPQRSCEGYIFTGWSRGGGGSGPGGGVPDPGGCLVRGRCLVLGGSALGGCLVPGGCLVQGVSGPGGLPGLGGVCYWGGLVPGGWYPSMY